MPWKDVPSEESVQHQYFGVWGWLIIFYIFGFLSTISDVIEPDPWILKFFFGSTGMVLVVSLIFMALQLPFLILVPMRHPLMPNIVITCTWVETVIVLPFVLSTDVTMDAPASLGTVVSIMVVVISALWTWYLLASKRVNLTFRHRVPALVLPQ